MDDLNLFRLKKFQDPAPVIDPEVRKEERKVEDDKKREAYQLLIKEVRPQTEGELV